MESKVLKSATRGVLAPLRTCAVGPELIVMDHFGSHQGKIRLFRGKEVLWTKDFSTGEQNMSHTVANLEHHHFKYEAHRRPGDVHIHFFGADAFSFGEKIKLQDGDIMDLELSGFGRSLRNPLRVVRAANTPSPARPL